ncbi:hypothetical protein [Streptomyces sp. 7-21]|uniref:hypothetical protein n=1 Tax=Streptomyces sp. 7-21 TaxID=2802283 RepID=UPI00191D3715|nr:hypothetical protein [Streptomyces sp. 7-21]MBL1068549.1 hypothetical protein [Streptomyces sp. 7-21]
MTDTTVDGRGEGRARHRARSPLIHPGPLPALLTAALAGAVAGTAALGQGALLPAVVVLQAVTAAGWFRLNGMWPARQGIALAFAGGLAADAALLLAPEDRVPHAMMGALGGWFLLVLLLQLRHRGSAEERLDSLTATAAATLLTVVAAAHLAAAGVDGATVVTAALGVAAAALARSVPGPAALGVVLGLLAGAGAGAAAGAAGWGAGGAAGWAVAAGAAGGCCALAGLRTASYDFPSRFVHFTAGVALPLTAAAPAVYPLAHAAA